MVLFGIIQIVWTLLGIQRGKTNKKDEADRKKIHDQIVDIKYV